MVLSLSSQTEAFQDHIAAGQTTLCRAWALTRSDGITLGFTDHDLPLAFENITFAPYAGLSAASLSQSTGLAVDNTEALGVLTDAAITEADIEAGRYDGVEVQVWMVNWRDVTVRWRQFCGTLGEIRRAGGAFHAELRGLTAALNRPLGRSYQKPCTAVLGDAACGFDLDSAGYTAEVTVAEVQDDRVLRFTATDLAGFAAGWFTRGRLDVLDGTAEGLWGSVKDDQTTGALREITLWHPLRARVVPQDRIRLLAGCDKRAGTCRLKFNNLLNYQGFPDLPGDDWVMSTPRSSGTNTGGSLR